MKKSSASLASIGTGPQAGTLNLENENHYTSRSKSGRDFLLSSYEEAQIEADYKEYEKERKIFNAEYLRNEKSKIDFSGHYFHGYQTKNVPVGLAYYALQNKMNRIMDLHTIGTYNASNSGGWVTKKNFIPEMARFFKVTERTIRAWINRLKYLGWIAKETKYKIQFRGARKVACGLGLEYNTIAKCPLKIIRNGRNSKSWKMGVVLADTLKVDFARISSQLTKDSSGKLYEHKSGESINVDYTGERGWRTGEIALSILSAKTKMSVAECSRLLLRGQWLGMCKVEHQFNLIFDKWEIRDEKTLEDFIDYKAKGELNTESLESWVDPRHLDNLKDIRNKGYVWDKNRKQYRLRYPNLYTTRLHVYSACHGWKRVSDSTTCIPSLTPKNDSFSFLFH